MGASLHHYERARHATEPRKNPIAQNHHVIKRRAQVTHVARETRGRVMQETPSLL